MSQQNMTDHGALPARERLLERLQDKGIRDIRVVLAMRQVPRHKFVDEALAWRAYDDDALPIDAGQTISQPYIVARMTELLMQVNPQKVLEVGTGSGYQAAVLSELVPQTYTVERIRRLHEKSKALLTELDLTYPVECLHSDGTWGYPQQAPYDAIIVTAAPEEVPEELLAQLRVGGRMLVPAGGNGEEQKLLCIDRTEKGFETETINSVVFVPMLQGKS